MGFLTNMPTEYRAKDVALNNRLNGVTGKHSELYGTLAIESTSIFNFAMNQIERSSAQSSESDATDERKTYLENEQKRILSELGWKANDNFNEKLENLKVFDEKTKLEAEILKLRQDNADDPTKIQDEINTKQKRIEELNAKIDNLNTTPKKTYEEAKKLVQQYLDNQIELDKISNGGVSEKTNGMKKFTSALKKWQNAKPEDKQKLAKNVKDAYKKMQQNGSIPLAVEQLWKLYDQEIDKDAA